MVEAKTIVNPLFLREEDLRQGMELLFFAARDFTARPEHQKRAGGSGEHFDHAGRGLPDKVVHGSGRARQRRPGGRERRGHWHTVTGRLLQKRRPTSGLCGGMDEDRARGGRPGGLPGGKTREATKKGRPAARARNERGPHRMGRRNRAGRVVPGAGLEPARSYEQEILSL